MWTFISILTFCVFVGISAARMAMSKGIILNGIGERMFRWLVISFVIASFLFLAGPHFFSSEDGKLSYKLIASSVIVGFIVGFQYFKRHLSRYQHEDAKMREAMKKQASKKRGGKI